MIQNGCYSVFPPAYYIHKLILFSPTTFYIDVDVFWLWYDDGISQ